MREGFAEEAIDAETAILLLEIQLIFHHSILLLVIVELLQRGEEVVFLEVDERDDVECTRGDSCLTTLEETFKTADVAFL